MAGKGYDLTAHTSKSVDAFAGTRVAVAVTMGCGDSCPLVGRGRRGRRRPAEVTMGCGDSCPLVGADRREGWNIPDPKELPDDEFREVRDLIERKEIELVAGLR